MSKFNVENRLSREEKAEMFKVKVPQLEGEEFRQVYIDGQRVHYKISNKGRLMNSDTGQIIIPGQNTTGYFHATINDKDAGIVAKQCTIHRLVAKTFIPNPGHKPYINHKNGLILDCTVDNLEWVTPKENSEHAVRHELYLYGDTNPYTKIPDKTIKQICRMYERGATIKQVSKKFGLNPNSAASIKHGNLRKNISKHYDLSKAGSDQPHDEDHYMSTFSNRTTHDICRDLESGMAIMDVAAKYKVSRGIVQQIKARKIHTHISKDYQVENSKRNKFNKHSQEILDEIIQRIMNRETNVEIAKAMADKGVTRRYVDGIRTRETHADLTKDYEFPDIYDSPTPDDVIQETAELLMQGLSNREIEERLMPKGLKRGIADCIRNHRAYKSRFGDWDFPPNKRKNSPRGVNKSKEYWYEKRMAKMREKIAKGGNLVIKFDGIRKNRVDW